MLSKRKRLRGADFKRFRGAKVIHTPHFLVRTVTGASRFGAAAVVSAAVAKKAVTRNLMRRRIYAILERLLLQQKQPQALLSITAKKGAAALSFQGMQDELTPALQQMPEIR